MKNILSHPDTNHFKNCLMLVRVSKKGVGIWQLWYFKVNNHAKETVVVPRIKNVNLFNETSGQSSVRSTYHFCGNIEQAAGTIKVKL